MMEIAEIAKYIRKEMKVADTYAYEAYKHRDQYPELAQKYYKAAVEHMEIADDLHAGAVRMIDDYKRSGHESPEIMRAVWSHEHDMMMDDRECVQRKLDMYKS